MEYKETIDKIDPVQLAEYKLMGYKVFVGISDAGIRQNYFFELNGVLHRHDGPAWMGWGYNKWFLYGEEFSEEEYNKCI